MSRFIEAIASVAIIPIMLCVWAFMSALPVLIGLIVLDIVGLVDLGWL